LYKSDLLRVFESISLMLEIQFTELQKHIEEEKLKTCHRHSINVFKTLSRKVSQFALDKILEQINLINVQDKSCSGCFSSSFGLPCSHKLYNYVISNEPIPVELINRQWILSAQKHNVNNISACTSSTIVLSPKSQTVATLFDSLNKIPLYQQEHVLENISLMVTNSIQEVNNPVVTKKRGRPVGAKQKSIKRDKSLFELVENELNGRKCSLCGQIG